MRVSNFAYERNEFQPKLAGGWILHCNLKPAHLACSPWGGGGGGLNVQGARKAIFLGLQ